MRYILAAWLTFSAVPAQAAMEPDEIMVRLATCMKLPPAYRGWCRPKHPTYRRTR